MAHPSKLSPRRFRRGIAVWLFQMMFPTLGVAYVLDRVGNQRALGRYSLTLLAVCLTWFVACWFALCVPRLRRRIVTCAAPLLLVYLSLLLFLLGAEVLSRVRLLAEWEQPQLRPRMEYSLELGWRLAPGEDDVSEHGWRLPVHALEKPTGCFRIVCIGDSTTFGLHCPWNGTWPCQLEVLCNQDSEWTRTHKPTEVLNLGVPGYGPDQGLITLKKYGLAYQPDVVVYHMCVNDFADASFDHDWRMPDGVTRYKPCYTLEEGRLVMKQGHAPPARDAAGNIYQAGAKRSIGFRSGFAMRLNARFDREESGLFVAYQNTWPIHDAFRSSYAAARPLVWALVREMANVSGRTGSAFLVTLSPAVMNAPADAPPWRVATFLREYEEDAAASRVLARQCIFEYFDQGGNTRFLTHPGGYHLNSSGNALIAEATLRWLKGQSSVASSGTCKAAIGDP